MGAAGGLFTATQWVELQRQSLIYNHMAASSPIPSYLVFSNINPAAAAAAAAAAPSQAAPSYYCCYNTPLLIHHYQAQQAAQMSMLLQCMQQAVARRRCGRTDGKKWRCARDAEPDQKYCQRHLNRVGRARPPPPARKQQHQHAAAAVVAHHRDRDKSAMTAPAAIHTSHGNKSSGNTMLREDDDDYSRGLLDFTGGVCLPEQRENRLSLNYDNIAELYCNRQVTATPTATASAAASATAMDDDAIHHGAAATWVGIGGPLGEALGLAVEIQWPAGST
ncbi:hypothetical protein TRIUR3_33546 [Triticum urartu]|uniref:Growth-regulating factor n=2 Tax=Triticum urartu TaxID=4572 RepID=M8B1U0_TRIUA|nr:hypothetical protein TRIUR3_33546 [Triticum urartu]